MDLSSFALPIHGTLTKTGLCFGNISILTYMKKIMLIQFYLMPDDIQKKDVKMNQAITEQGSD